MQTTTKIGDDGKQVTAPITQSVTVTTESVKADAAAAAATAAATAAAAQKPVRPEWCPEKFWNAETGAVNNEALAKSYVELEKRPAAAKPADAAANTMVPAKNADGTPKLNADGTPVMEQKAPEQKVDPNASAAQAAAIDAAAKAYAETGTLDEAARTGLKAAGYTDGQIDTYMAGVKAQETTIYAQAFEIVGGEQNYAAMLQWASANLTADEIADFDTRVGNSKTMKGAIKELADRQKMSIGTDGVKTTGSTPNATTAVEPYKSKHDLMAAVKSPEYKTSAAFRHQHGLRILAAEAQGINLWA